jgi:hypothetical protein
MGNEKWGNEEMKKWDGNIRQARSGDEKLRYSLAMAVCAHEINFCKINSHVINSYKSYFLSSQLSGHQLR